MLVYNVVAGKLIVSTGVRQAYGVHCLSCSWEIDPKDNLHADHQAREHAKTYVGHNVVVDFDVSRFYCVEATAPLS